MSLTSHLKDPTSPVRAFLRDRFPLERVGALAREVGSELAQAATLRPPGQYENWEYSLIGTSHDYRLRYLLAIYPPEATVAWLGAWTYLCGGEGEWQFEDLPDVPDIDGMRIRPDLPSAGFGRVEGFELPPQLIGGFFASLRRALDRIRPVGRLLEPESEAWLNRYCVVLALFEQVFRAGPRKGSPLFSLPRNPAIGDLLALARPTWLDDLANLVRASWQAIEPFTSPGHRLTLNPVFEGSSHVGGADADLVLDGVLWEVKTTITNRVRPEWIHQLLGYVLLDYSDRYGIRGVSILFPRQGLRKEWGLGELLGRLGRSALPPLRQPRSDFRELLTPV